MLAGGEDRRTSDISLAAVREALGDFPDPSRLAVVGATTSADMRTAEPAWQQKVAGEALSDPGAFVWPQLCHVPTQFVAQQIGARGIRLTLSTACTSGASAVAVAADLVRAGRAPAAVAFGGDALCHTTVHGFGSLGLYDPSPCRPFGPDRMGLNIGEGAAALLLEPLETALARGAEPLAILAGFGNTSDGYRLTAPDPLGVQAAVAIRTALGEYPSQDVRYVCAHATGTRLNDQAEAALVLRELPNAALSGIKGAVGHTLGAAGAAEAVVATLAVHYGRIPPHVGSGRNEFGDVDVPRTVRDQALDSAMSVNFAFGGNNTALLLRRWSP
jgi:3-oxoacyl-[acyl-carrier-protein] synthase II